MRMHTLLTKAASIAVCFGIFLSGPASAYGALETGAVRDVELSEEGTLYGQVFTSEGHAVSHAQIELRYQGTAVARTASVTDGQFAVAGVRGGVHEVTVGSLTTPVRLWKHGTAPQGALSGLVVSGSEHVVRGQACDIYGNPVCPTPASTGFGLIDIVTLAMLGTSVTALVFAIDTHNKVKNLELVVPASP